MPLPTIILLLDKNLYYVIKKDVHKVFSVYIKAHAFQILGEIASLVFILNAKMCPM